MASILTLLGVAIGLGNVWRFPYMMGKYGGSAFLIVYLLFTLFFAFPALMAELTLGQRSGKGTVDAFRMTWGRTWGGILGYMLLIVITVAGAYYAVVVSNVLYTTGFSTTIGFTPESAVKYGAYLSNGWMQYGITVVLIFASMYVIDRGLINGIERISKVFMPLFFLALLYMIARAWVMPGALDKCIEFLQPDWSLLHAPELFAALGQAFFSVGLGGTFVVVYAGFLRKGENIPKVALATGLGDAGASLLFSLFLIPSMLALDIPMDSGPSLIFDTFPKLFYQMPGGRFVGSLFLLSISIVAFLSLVAAYQVPFTSVQSEYPGIERRKILWIIGGVQLILALPCALYPQIIGTLDLVFGSGMQVFGSALCILGLTWGLKRSEVFRDMLKVGEPRTIHRLVYLWLQWIIPLALLAVLVNYIVDVAS
jgi:NSS family neurotransmitter:Na+ symporter